MSGPGSPGSACAGWGPWRSSPGPRSSLGSGRRARGSMPGPGARRPIRSGRAGHPSAWPCTCRSSRRRRSSSRSVSSSTGWPAPSPASCWPRGLAATRAHLRLELDLAFARVGTASELTVEQRFRTDRRCRGDRAPPVRPPGARPAAGRGGPPGPRAGRGGAGGRSAAPVVRAAGGPRCAAGLAAGRGSP